MTAPSNKEAQNVTFSDFGMTTVGLHVIAKDGSHEAVAEVVPEYKDIVLKSLNSHSTESAERDKLIERTQSIITLLDSQIKQMEYLGYEIKSRGEALELFKDLLQHLRGSEPGGTAGRW